MFGLYFGEKYQRQSDAANVEDEPYESEQVVIRYNDTEYRQRDDLDYYLFMGVDKTTETLSDPTLKINNQQADFLVLMVVDRTSDSYYGIHINRDTMTDIKRLGISGESLGTYVAQICLSHTYGSGGKDSCRNTVWAVSRYFYDLPIKHYFAITMDGIPVLNDTAGGVVVHVTDDFSKVDPSLVMGRDIRLKGEQALTYVRGRMSVADGTNLNRMKRQREYMNGLYKQLNIKLAQDDAFALRLANSISEYMTSDLTTDQLASLSENLKDYNFMGIYTIEGEAILNTKTNHIEFYEDEDSFQKLVVRLFFQRLPD